MITSNAGHGGKDPGASGNGIIEKHFALDVDNYYTSDLNRQGIAVERTRTTDTYQSPSSIGRQIRDSKNQVGVAHHANKFTVSSANGVEVLYNPKSAASKRLAECILTELVKLGLTNRKTKARTNLAVLNIPSKSKAVVIIEYGFMSNKHDADILKNKTKELGQAAARGTLKYLGIEYKEPIQEVKYKVENKKINVNGRDKTYKTITDKGTTYVELRKFAEDMNNKVEYDDKTAKISTKLSVLDIVYKGKVIELERFKLNDLNYVELRKALESLGHTVKYNAVDKKIYIE